MWELYITALSPTQRTNTVTLLLFDHINKTALDSTEGRGCISLAPCLGDSRFQTVYACVGVLPGHGLRGAQVLMAIRDAAPGTARSFSFLEMHSMRVKYSPFQPSPERAITVNHSPRALWLSSVKCRALLIPGTAIAQGPPPGSPGSGLILLYPLSTRNYRPLSPLFRSTQ